MLRTWLFVPGHEPDKMCKALASSADVVIIDWEDAVPPNQKQEAQMQTQEVFAQAMTPCRVAIRMNRLKSPWSGDDLLTLKNLTVAAIMVPKTEDPAEIFALAADVPMIPLRESALDVEQAFAIARAHTLIERLVIAGRVAGLTGKIDGVYPRLSDVEGLRKESVLAYTLGCEGKQVLHPRQIEVVNEACQSTGEEITRARLVIRVAQEAATERCAAIQIEGIFIDPPVVRWAHQTLQAIGEA
jgi:citrate lyase subunit beta/citryl-CoA lyase